MTSQDVRTTWDDEVMAKQTCELCGRQETVTPDGRGFPPDIAKRKLVKWCKANGCKSKPVYSPDVSFGHRPMGMTAT